MNRFLGLCSLLVIVVFSFCKNSNHSTVKATDLAVSGDAVPAGFDAFYEKFHSDSAYQMAHIAWPLQGTKGVQIDSSSTGIQPASWEPATWRMQKLDLLQSGEYTTERSVIGDIMVIERIRAIAVPFGIERRFAKQSNNEWELIYYADTFEFK